LRLGTSTSTPTRTGTRTRARARARARICIRTRARARTPRTNAPVRSPRVAGVRSLGPSRSPTIDGRLRRLRAAWGARGSGVTGGADALRAREAHGHPQAQGGPLPLHFPFVSRLSTEVKLPATLPSVHAREVLGDLRQGHRLRCETGPHDGPRHPVDDRR